jgi:hypothetical protein
LLRGEALSPRLCTAPLRSPLLLVELLPIVRLLPRAHLQRLDDHWRAGSAGQSATGR